MARRRRTGEQSGGDLSARDLKAAQANPVDRHVGSRIRSRRVMLGLSQKSLADAIGVKFPQVQKYEDGVNRLSASRLFAVSRVLGAPITYFFEGMSDGTRDAAPGSNAEPEPHGSAPETMSRIDESLFARPETLDLVRSYYAIRSRRVRRSLVIMMEYLTALDGRGVDEP